ncbi:acylphosphatase [Anaerococcus sp.]|uniref:acylphosphatase n=1 Tax=Anaerococcus sp. TaxID=1872515 RepID=UPI0027B9B417|nr:acylphosphatase [Anaerococcus sp.]
MERLKINFKGRVQGVGFRFHSLRIATDLNLTGNVKNLYDGSVEVNVQGSTENIDAFVRELYKQRFVRIESKDISKIDIKNDEKSFEILY